MRNFIDGRLAGALLVIVATACSGNSGAHAAFERHANGVRPSLEQFAAATREVHQAQAAVVSAGPETGLSASAHLYQACRDLRDASGTLGDALEPLTREPDLDEGSRTDLGDAQLIIRRFIEAESNGADGPDGFFGDVRACMDAAREVVSVVRSIVTDARRNGVTLPEVPQLDGARS